MHLSALRPIYKHDGPFVTVYLEGRSPSEDASEQIRLRWQALRERLESAGASAAAVDAAESALLSATSGEEQANGRVLVADDSGVLLDEPWDAALGAGDNAHWGPLPELGSYVRERARAVRELVVITDQQGARVRQDVIAEQHEPRGVATGSVEGSSAEGVHKPRQGALSHNQIQRRADESVKRNAKDIAEHLRTTAAKFAPRVLVLAGEVQGRTAVREALPTELSEILVETQRGGQDESRSDELLNDELVRIAKTESDRVAAEHGERFEAGLAHGNAVQGAHSVENAVRSAAVETLLLEYDRHAPDEAELLKACAQASSDAALVPEQTTLTDGVGALLRFPVNTP